MVMTMMMHYFADAMNYGGLMYCDQRSATFNSYDYTRATASVPAGTSLFLSTNYSNVDESSTNFRQLKKAFNFL